MKTYQSIGEKIFEAFNIAFMFVMTIIMIYPLWYVICASFSNSDMLSATSDMLLVPLKFSTRAYELMFNNPMVFRGLYNSIMILVAGVTLNILLTSCGAYFLSRKNIRLKKTVSLYIIFTMFFSGGLVPFYLTVKGYGLYNNFWALIFPSAINTFNLIIMRTGFEAVPDSLEESAKIDGASHFRILFGIIIPLSKSIIAVMILYYAVGHWNSWFNAMIFLKDRELFPLQLVLRQILIESDNSEMTTNIALGDRESVGETIKYAVIVFSTMPIIVLYPFLQKYFVKGVLIGAVKG